MNDYTKQSDELLQEPVETALTTTPTSDGAEVSRVGEFQEGHKDIVFIQEVGPDEANHQHNL